MKIVIRGNAYSPIEIAYFCNRKRGHRLRKCKRGNLYDRLGVTLVSEKGERRPLAPRVNTRPNRIRER